MRVVLAGGAAPEFAPDDGRTMNVASFFDLDGDGLADVEIWANISSEGWMAASCTPGSPGPNRFGEESGVRILIDGSDLVLVFPATHLV